MRTLLLALAATACTHVTNDFVCATDSDCTTASGATGHCEGNHRCSLEDTGCASGFRFGDLAGDAANQCTSDVCSTLVRAGADDTCTVHGDGTVWCWGGGQTAASRVDVPAGTIAQLDDAAGGLCVRYADNTLYCARGATTGSIALTTTGVAIGTDHTCAITGTGAVSCWGDNARGQLGDDSMTSHATPAAVHDLSGVKQLASGLTTSCAVNSSGQVWCWGDDNRGQIGRGLSAFENSTLPLQAQAAGFTDAAQVAVGDLFTCSVTHNGALWCWGDDDSYQCALSNTLVLMMEYDSPAQVTGAPGGLVQVTAGSTHACARAGDGKVYCWGGNHAHQAAASDADPIMSPVVVVDGTGDPILFRDVTAGGNHTCGTTTDGALLCWGDNAKGQIGDGTTHTAITPTPVGLACR